jgi:drug/metabolite transporter (DMT)-like permease
MNSTSKLFFGTIFGICNVIVVGLLNISVKVITCENIHTHVQCYYVGFTNSILGFIHIFLIEGKFKISFWYFIFSFSNGSLYYLANLSIIEGYKHIQVSKTSPLAYLTTLTVFILGVLILSEPIYFTDFLGSALILSYNVYYAWVPAEKSNT